MAMDWIEPNFASPSLYLPPQEVKLYDPRKEGRLETPVHSSTGLVDRQGLMFLIKSTVIPEYDWKSPAVTMQRNDHHLHWPHPWYENKKFRNHGSRRTKIAPIAHNHIHDVTRPAAPASPDVEHEYIEGQSLADQMRSTVSYPLYIGRQTVRIYKEVYGDMPVEQLTAVKRDAHVDLQIDLEEQLDTFGQLFERAKAGPKEFQVIDYSEFQLNNVSDMMKISRRIIRQAVYEAEMDQKILNGEVQRLVA